MRGEHICLGGHDLDDAFRSVRLLTKFGDHWDQEAPFQVGDLCEIRYWPAHKPRLPHVEDVYVMEYRRLEHAGGLASLVLRHAQPWVGDAASLFGGAVRRTASGAAYIAADGTLPRRSTGYWRPTTPLVRQQGHRGCRLASDGEVLWALPWVGCAPPPTDIAAGDLVRISLSRLFQRDGVVPGYYVQISGVLVMSAGDGAYA